MVILAYFPSEPEHKLNGFVFPLAVIFAEREESGTYTNLLRVFVCSSGRMCGKRGSTTGRYNVLTYMDLVILQMLLWESFGALAPTPVEYSATVSGGTGVVSPTKSILNARVPRWAGSRAVNRYLKI